MVEATTATKLSDNQEKKPTEPAQPAATSIAPEEESKVPKP